MKYSKGALSAQFWRIMLMQGNYSPQVSIGVACLYAYCTLAANTGWFLGKASHLDLNLLITPLSFVPLYLSNSPYAVSSIPLAPFSIALSLQSEHAHRNCPTRATKYLLKTCIVHCSWCQIWNLNQTKICDILPKVYRTLSRCVNKFIVRQFCSWKESTVHLVSHWINERLFLSVLSLVLTFNYSCVYVVSSFFGGFLVTAVCL